MDTGKQAIWSNDETRFPRRFGPYVLVTYLGEGGMGRVYLALERIATGDHLVVIKRFGNPHSRFTPEQIRENQERFAREAEISSSLEHPCIARTLHAVPQGTDSYLVQEFIHGITVEYLVGSLADEDERVPTPLAIHIVTEIARALAYLHDFRNLGLVHRDLTSANVMLSRAGDVKVIDFGIAKATLVDDSLTRPNVLIGKPMWTAPEVLAGAKPDRRADLYSLGLIAWQLLTGRDPAEQLATGHALPPPSSFNAAIGADCDRLVAKAVAPRPEVRFQTAREFGDQLDFLLPADFHGSGQLGQLLQAREGFGQKKSFDALVERARALFVDDPSTSIALPRRRLIPLGVALLGLASIGVFALLRGGSGQPAPTYPPPISPPPALPPSPPELPDSSPPAASPDPPVPPENVRVPPPPPSTAPSRTHAGSPPPRQTRPIGHSVQREPPPATAPAVHKSPQDLLDEALDAYSVADTEAALKLARASIAERPNAEAYVLIGRILKRTDPAAARAALETALRLSPGNPKAARLLEGL